MNESMPSRRCVDSCLEEVKAKIGRIPAIRRNSFVYGVLLFLVGYGAFLLPPSGPPQALELGIIVLFGLLTIGWAVVFFTDELKPEALKTVTVFALMTVAAWLYYRYSTARWGEMTGLFFNWEVIEKAWPTLIEGLWTTFCWPCLRRS